MTLKPRPRTGFDIDAMIDSAHEASAFLKALAHEARLVILCLLLEKELSVTEIEDILRMRQPAISQQLARLRADGLVDTRRDGKNIYYSLARTETREVIGALHLLADWQLQFGRDAQAAIGSLQRIVQLYPGTPFAHAAEQRIAHLGSADETSRVRYQGKFTMAPGKRDIGLRKDSAPVPAPADPHALAEEYVRQLELHPSDTDTREKLAVLYAEAFQRLDLAADQLEQLIGLPAEPPKHVARWLNLLATLHIQVAHDVAAAESALHRIIERFPGGALADLAVSRLASLQSELKPSQSTPTKTLGSYEKDIGLKQTHG